MKSKEKEVKRSLSTAELKVELVQLREKQFKLRFKHRVTPLENPLQLRTLRRNIARIETWIRAKDSQGN